MLAFVRDPGPLVEHLEARTTRRRRLDAGWVRAAVGVALLVGVPLLLTRSIAWGACVVALWLFAALERWSYRARTVAALAPVRDTPRSLLAEASGTVELAVRARMRGAGVRSFLGDDVVAFSELRIREVYFAEVGGDRSRQRLASRMVRVYRASAQFEIVDESGEGELHLHDTGGLDAEVRRVRARRLPPNIADRGILLPRAAVYYVIEESVIKDGEPLYILGEVSKIELRSGQDGYRGVRSAPMIGGRGTPPIVYAGSERGLVAKLQGHARAATGLFAAFVLASLALTAALFYITRS